LNVVCAKTHRRFSSVEAIRHCALSHDRCEYCLYPMGDANASPKDGPIILTSDEIKSLTSRSNSELDDPAPAIAKEIELTQCPQCKKQALTLNWSTDHYECLACKESFNRVLVDRDRLILENQRKALNSNSNSKAWSGNQVWNEKRKRWEIGFRSRPTSSFNWLWILFHLSLCLLVYWEL
jgi:hypothetical protein